jgi:hypothetical protein
LTYAAAPDHGARPNKDAGYDVRVIDLPQDVRLIEKPRMPVSPERDCRVPWTASDVVDGSYGEPQPNKAMYLLQSVEQEIERSKAPAVAAMVPQE